MRLKPAAALLMTVILFFSGTMSVFAVQFTDINDAPWAVTHIERMAEKGIISGSIHATTGQRVYLPNNPVTKVESVVMLYSLLQKTGHLMSATDYTNKYQTMLNTAQIPDWAQKQVGYALENAIITTGDLSTFMRAASPDPMQNPASREEVAVYFGRTLDKNRQAAGSTVSLNFLDTEAISSAALPYVNLLVQKRIISGDNENRFNPRATITRAEMAALSNKSYDVIEGSGEIIIELKPVDPAPQPSVGQQSRIRTGEIQLVNLDTGIIVVDYDDDNERDILEVTGSTIIRINSLPHELINLRQGQNAEFTFDNQNELIRIEINPRRTYYYGKVFQIVDLLDYYAVIFESLSDSSERKSFKVDSQTIILVDGSARTLSSLQTGDQVRVEYDGQTALTIEKGTFDVQTHEIDGILESAVNFQRLPYTIQVKTTGNQIREYEIDDSVVVRIGGSRGYLEELTKGDVVTLQIDGEKGSRITRIEALGLESVRKVEGTIESMTISRTIQIKFVDRNRAESTYVVAETARVYENNQRIDLRDIRLPAEATLYFEGNLVTEIEASPAFGTQVVQGRIVRVRDSSNMIIVRHMTASGAYQEIPVYATDNTLIIDRSGREIRMRDLATDQEVFATGIYDGTEFTADRILVIQD